MDDSAPGKDRSEAAPDWELRALSDDALLARLSALAGQERETVAEFIRHLIEVDRREIVTDRGYTNLYDYCRKILHYSESEAFLRMRAARAASHYPRIIQDLRSGALHLDGIARLYPHLQDNNANSILDRASGATSREVMKLAVELGSERPVDRDVIRIVAPIRSEPQSPREPEISLFSSPPPTPPAVAEPGTASSSAAGEALDGSPMMRTPASVIPAPMFRLSFTADEKFLQAVERLRAMRRHKFPDGRLEDLLNEAVLALLAKLEPARPRAERPLKRRASGKNRWIPMKVKRLVWQRDGGRCAYTASDGRRCEATEFLEYDHVKPWSVGGASDDPDNIRLLCRPHNQRLARRRFGPRKNPSLLCANTVAKDFPRTEGT